MNLFISMALVLCNVIGALQIFIAYQLTCLFIIPRVLRTILPDDVLITFYISNILQAIGLWSIGAAALAAVPNPRSKAGTNRQLNRMAAIAASPLSPVAMATFMVRERARGVPNTTSNDTNYIANNVTPNHNNNVNNGNGGVDDSVNEVTSKNGTTSHHSVVGPLLPFPMPHLPPRNVTHLNNGPSNANTSNDNVILTSPPLPPHHQQASLQLQL
jgi:hypothetical protein